MDTVCQVCIPHTGRDAWDYAITEAVPCVGARVQVTFRNQTRTGIVTGHGTSERPGLALKPVTRILDETPCLPESILSLCTWASQYYQTPLSEVIPLAMPKPLREGAPAVPDAIPCVRLACPGFLAHTHIPKNAHRQHALIDFLEAQPAPVPVDTLAQAGFGTALLRNLVQKDLILRELAAAPAESAGVAPDTPLILNAEQAHAHETICRQLDCFGAFLLQGVTGSGKTEVYLQVLAKVLAAGRQALVLVPEIGLTPQLLERFTQRFSEPMVVLHSNLSDSARRKAWIRAREGHARLVIGTRTAIFTPMPDLGLIVIDEEHDASLKQNDGVRYSARDAALIRAQSANIPVILGSATPSLESLYNAESGKYHKLELNQRAQSQHPTLFRVLDIRNQPLTEGLAEPAMQAIEKHLDAGNQVLVFINRRGFSPVLLCHQCGWMADCKACDSHMTLHLQARKLQCHHCGRSAAVPTHCQTCRTPSLIPVGAGTQRVFEALRERFADIPMARIDRDETRRKGTLEAALGAISRNEIRLMVGTQMLAKGHHFPRLTLVVILDTDAGFYNQDFRATERLGQLLTQVAGRAGRAALQGEVLLQTHLPDHPLLNVLVREGYAAFARELLAARKKAALPPFHYLALLRAEGKQPQTVLHFLHAAKGTLAEHGLDVLGPAPAPLAKKAHRHRMQLLLRSSHRKKLHHALAALRHWLEKPAHSKGIQWNLDVDPADLS